VPQEHTTVTEDGVTLGVDDRAFNYYDMKPGRIQRFLGFPQPDPAKGQSSATPLEEWTNYWFIFEHDDGTSADLDGSRICSVQFAQKKGWLS